MQVRWCSQQYLDFTVTFSLVCLLGRKFRDEMNTVTELQLQSSDVICLQEVQKKFLLILSGYLLETTYNFYT